MRKNKTLQPLSRNMLRGLAVIFAANQILHLEKNGLAVRSNKDENNGGAVRIDQDIQFDIGTEELMKAKDGIDELEKISMQVLKSVKIGKKDRTFFAEKTEQIVSAYLSSGILDKGVSPHLSFVLILFTYFIDGAKRVPYKVFDPVKNPDIYDDIIVRFEDSNVFDWPAHADAAALALHKGVGLSIADYDEKMSKAATSDLENTEGNHDRTDQR